MGKTFTEQLEQQLHDNFHSSVPRSNQSSQAMSAPAPTPEMKHAEIIRYWRTFPALLPAAEPKAAGWKKQMEWAKEQGGDLPTRPEQSVLYANLPGEFQKEWYWSNRPYAGGDAWGQGFDYGHQGIHRKYGRLRARAVRRIAI